MNRQLKRVQSRLKRVNWGFARAKARQAMRGVSAGSRVWMQDQNEVRFGVIQTISIWPGYFRVNGSLIIVLDGDYRRQSGQDEGPIGVKR